MAQRKITPSTRNLFKEPLNVAELKAIAARAGGIRELIAPTKRAGTESMTDAQVARWLAEDPRRLRRPIIDTGDEVLLGFTRSVRERLSSAL